MNGDLGVVRDLIETGLNEPADATARYGICAATPVPGSRFGATEQPCVGVGDIESVALVAATGVAIGIFGASMGRCPWPVDARTRWRTQVVVACVGAATPPGSIFEREPMFMMCRTVNGRARMLR